MTGYATAHDHSHAENQCSGRPLKPVTRTVEIPETIADMRPVNTSGITNLCVHAGSFFTSPLYQIPKLGSGMRSIACGSLNETLFIAGVTGYISIFAEGYCQSIE